MERRVIVYFVYTENEKYRATAGNCVSALLVALWLGWRSYFDLDPQRVVTERHVYRISR